MITQITNDNKNAYSILFTDASDLLSGYQKIERFNIDIPGYYIKEDKAFIQLENINSATAFAKATLDENGNARSIYAKVKFAVSDNKDENGLASWYTNEDVANDMGWGPVNGFDASFPITTLAEYYSWIRTLGKADKKYTVLPVEEVDAEVFSINANTRAITIPSHFIKNGFGVVGDSYAEIVYFSIDRYYDMMDLNNADIYVLWETPDKKKGFSSPYVRYLTTITNSKGEQCEKVIFGWPISSTIAEKAGALKFSVRFFEEDAENNTTFNFNTLTASCGIKDTLKHTKEGATIENDHSIIVDRLENSSIAGSGVTAAIPEITVSVIIDGEEVAAADEYDLGLESTVLRANATVSDNGIVTYYWNNDTQIANTDLSVLKAGSYYATAENRIINHISKSTSERIVFPEPKDIMTSDIDEVVTVFRLGEGESAEITLEDFEKKHNNGVSKITLPTKITPKLDMAEDKSKCVYSYTLGLEEVILENDSFIPSTDLLLDKEYNFTIVKTRNLETKEKSSETKYVIEAIPQRPEFTGTGEQQITLLELQGDSTLGFDINNYINDENIIYVEWYLSRNGARVGGVEVTDAENIPVFNPYYDASLTDFDITAAYYPIIFSKVGNITLGTKVTNDTFMFQVVE